jgi:hypothetical protein
MQGWIQRVDSKGGFKGWIQRSCCGCKGGCKSRAVDARVDTKTKGGTVVTKGGTVVTKGVPAAGHILIHVIEQFVAPLLALRLPLDSITHLPLRLAYHLMQRSEEGQRRVACYVSLQRER